ncbi:LOW QUALITY PROTEIN: RND multidrug efflux transporter [Bacillus sp. JCM 19045]|nr:LOW QUALITY PROTEIN: RND multidrug efflux transporter [Bacillus sp. JCM 19045]
MVKSIISFSINNKFAIWLLTILITVAGIFAGTTMNQEVIPNIDAPLVSVTSIYPGATPEEMAEEVTIPIEQAVENLNGVAVVQSSSFENVSSMQIEYEFSKDMTEAEAEVKEAVEAISFTDGVEAPTVSRLSFGAFPVLTLSVSEDGKTLAELTEQVENEIIPSLEGLPGIASVAATGQEMQEVEITFDQEALAENGLTEDMITQLMEAQSMRFPLGLYTFGDTEQSVVIDGRGTTIDDLKELQLPVTPPSLGEMEMDNIPPAQGEGAQMPAMEPSMVALEDVATVEVVTQSESISRTNGQTSIGVEIVKASDANTVEVVEEVREAIVEFEENGVTIATTMDQAEPIEEAVATMLSKALFGAMFAVLIILLFLRNIKSTIISVISIPISLFIALILLQQLDITLNLMTLGAMTVAIGRVIDDSIVVVENIFRRMGSKTETLKEEHLFRVQQKKYLNRSYRQRLRVRCFCRLDLKALLGNYFYRLATVIFALFASLLVAITVVPMMAHTMFKKGVPAKQVHDESKPGKLASAYRKLLQWTLNHKWITGLIAVALLVGSLFLTPFVGVSFLPEDEEKMVFATYSPNAGTTFADAEADVNEAEAILLARDGIDTFQFSLGGSSPMPMVATGSNSAIFYIQYEDDFEGFSAEKTALLEEMEQVTENGTWSSQDIATGGMGSSDLSIRVYGETAEEIEPVIEEVTSIMEQYDDLDEPETTISDRYNEYTLEIDKDQVTQYGLTTAQVGWRFIPAKMLTPRQGEGQTLDVVVATDEEQYDDLDELLAVMIPTSMGTEVAVADLVTVEEGTTSSTITRREGQIYAEVSAKILSDDVTQVSGDVMEEVGELELPAGVTTQTGGVTADIEESFTQLGLAMLAAIAIVYFVLVVTFGGGLAPFAILFSLPFIAIGSLVGLFITGETISISVLIGVLMLIGIVVTNAIVLIDRVIHKEREGLSTREALLEAGTTRLRPILMTALATIGALLPLAFGLEGGGLISKGLGITVIGGLTSSTLLTLVIVPIVYEALMKMKRKIKTEG